MEGLKMEFRINIEISNKGIDKYTDRYRTEEIQAALEDVANELRKVGTYDGNILDNDGVKIGTFDLMNVYS